jgi:hypothetical protein
LLNIDNKPRAHLQAICRMQKIKGNYHPEVQVSSIDATAGRFHTPVYPSGTRPATLK